MKRAYVLLYFLLFVTPTVSNAFTFAGPLKLGDSGFSVRELQRSLNLSVDTKIADAGPGSPGNETDYFGSLTKNAVRRFQQKYASDILTPAGLTSGTGYVGGFTIKKLNSMSGNAYPQNQTTTIGTISPGSPSPSATTSTDSLPTITKVSKISFLPREVITINGTGFIAPLSVHIGDYTASNPKINNPTEVEAVLPNQFGVFLVWVGNKNGDSRASYPMFIVIQGDSVGSPSNISDIVRMIEQQNNAIQNRAKSLNGL